MMLRISEVYTSLQGEGPNTGLPTQFVRFAGCNLRCPGWPCDTPHAIEPSIWRKEALKIEESNDAIDLVADWPRAVTLTGGEPFTQNDAMLQEFVEGLWNRGYTLEVFTNGTKEFPQWAFPKLRFMLDWKLRGSGEEISGDIREQNALKLNRYDGVKFVCKNMDDVEEAVMWTNFFRDLRVDASLWAGIVWGSEDITDALLSEYILANELPWRLNVQMHNHIWDPQERGR